MNILFLFGTSVSFYFLNYLFSPKLADLFIEYWKYVIGYILIAGIISFGIVYRYGPVEDRRTLSLIQWCLQFVGLVLVYNSTQIPEVSWALVVILLTIYNFPRIEIKNQRLKNLW